MGSGAGAGLEEMSWEESGSAAGAGTGTSNSEIVDRRGLPAEDDTKESSDALKGSVLVDMATCKFIYLERPSVPLAGEEGTRARQLMKEKDRSYEERKRGAQRLRTTLSLGIERETL